MASGQQRVDDGYWLRSMDSRYGHLYIPRRKGALMFNRVLTCLDGSNLAEQILPYAAETATRFGGTLVLLRVVTVEGTISAAAVPEAIGYGYTGEVMMTEIDMIERDARTYLEGVAAQLQGEVVNVVLETLHGTPVGQMIVDYANENKVDLITMATHGRSGVRRAVLGSVADHVLRESHLPVLLIRPRE